MLLLLRLTTLVLIGIGISTLDLRRVVIVLPLFMGFGDLVDGVDTRAGEIGSFDEAHGNGDVVW